MHALRKKQKQKQKKTKPKNRPRGATENKYLSKIQEEKHS